jgi:hypothetical protein
MPKKVSFNFRLSETEKQSFFHNAKCLGANPSTLLTMFIINFNKTKKVTFSVDEPLKLEPFIPDKVENIMKDFKSTGKYNQSFLKDLEAGLKRSTLNNIS